MTRRHVNVAPRTLSADPPSPCRAPAGARDRSHFPSLAAVLAGTSLAAGCHDPACGEQRSDELEAHGPDVLRHTRAGHGAAALREIGVALGAIAHTPTEPRGEMRTAGVQAPTETTPMLPVAPPHVVAPPQDDAPRPTRMGRVRIAGPAPADPPAAPTRPTRLTAPTSAHGNNSRADGGLRSVGPAAPHGTDPLGD